MVQSNAHELPWHDRQKARRRRRLTSESGTVMGKPSRLSWMAGSINMTCQNSDNEPTKQQK